jgi:hypothetical protein
MIDNPTPRGKRWSERDFETRFPALVSHYAR